MSAMLAFLAAAALAAGAEIGQTVPDFRASALDGTPFSLAESVAAHELVVVVFVSTACPYSVYFADHLRELDERYRARGVMVVGVNSNQYETDSDMREDARAHGQAFPLIRDGDARIADLLGAGRNPEAFVIARDGRVRYRGWVQSKLRSPDLERAIDALLAGRPLRRARTRAFGCTIDRASRPGAALGSRP